MVYITDWDEFASKAEQVFNAAPSKVWFPSIYVAVAVFLFLLL